MNETLEKMLAAGHLSAPDAESLGRLATNGKAHLVENEASVLRWLSGEYGVAYTELEDVRPDRELLSLFPARVLLKEELLPLRRIDGAIEIATSRLFATRGLDTLKLMTGLRLVPVLAPSENIRKEIKRHLGVGADTIDTLKDDESFTILEEDADDESNLDGAASEASIIRFVNQVLGDAIELRTTDIHIEPFENELRIRYRIDGVLQEVPVPAEIKRFQPAIVSRVKILSHLNIAEKRVPQDGRIKIRVGDADVDVRVSIIPMLHGEAVVMRLLRQDGKILGLAELGMARRERALFDRMLAQPHGIVLVTGPTGSGKTTTLYAALNQINDSVRKIVAIEDPVEYQIRGINQIQVSEKAGLTFARGLRSILRHDPDVLLIGEIRDRETARIAVQASLTGHLVFSTLHTNDAPGAISRLIDMGVEPYLVASSVEAVLAQRLVRVLCTGCRRPDTSDRIRLLRGEIGIDPRATVHRAEGCEECRHTGYHGRQAIFEMMDMTPEIREMTLRHSSSNQIRQQALRDGMGTLGRDGWRLVEEGITTPDEVLRVSKDEPVIQA